MEKTQFSESRFFKIIWGMVALVVVIFCFIASWMSYPQLLTWLMSDHSFPFVSSSMSGVFQHKVISSASFVLSAAVFMFMLGLLRKNSLSIQGSILFLVFYVVDLWLCFWLNRYFLNHLFSRSLHPEIRRIAVAISIDNIPIARIGLYSAAVIMLIGLGMLSLLKCNRSICMP